MSRRPGDSLSRRSRALLVNKGGIFNQKCFLDSHIISFFREAVVACYALCASCRKRISGGGVRQCRRSGNGHSMLRCRPFSGDVAKQRLRQCRRAAAPSVNAREAKMCIRPGRVLCCHFGFRMRAFGKCIWHAKWHNARRADVSFSARTASIQHQWQTHAATGISWRARRRNDEVLGRRTSSSAHQYMKAIYFFSKSCRGSNQGIFGILWR